MTYERKLFLTPQSRLPSTIAPCSAPSPPPCRSPSRWKTSSGWGAPPWAGTDLEGQEDIFGRDKGEGAAVGKAKERDEPFLPAMLPTAHVRLAHPDSNSGAKMLRRGYSFTDGTDGLGRLDAGLFFLAYQRDTRKGFVPVQRSLAASDVLNEYIQHVGSALFAIPPGVRDQDDWWGRALFS